MKLAVVVGGWHFPLQLFKCLAAQANGADLFVVAHRDPELPVVREEKRDILATAKGQLADLDRELYGAFPTVQGLRDIGWQYAEEANVCGDWMFFNQWAQRHDYSAYDVILICHDDTYIRRYDLFDQVRIPDSYWLILANGKYQQAPPAYVRGSFEFFKREMLDLLGGRFDLGHIGLTREGKTDSPAGLAALSEWNNTGVPLRDFMVSRGLVDRIAYLSQTYRVSRWAIEGERGFMHYSDGAPWSFAEGIKQFSQPYACYSH